MADNHQEVARKKALASGYADIVRKHEEQIDESLSTAQYDFFRNRWSSVDTTIFSNLLTAMKKPDTIPSEYVSRELGWLFEAAIPKREKAVIMYFADRLQEYPYSDSYCRRSFRAKRSRRYDFCF